MMKKKEFFQKYDKVNYQQCVLKKRGEKKTFISIKNQIDAFI